MPTDPIHDQRQFRAWQRGDETAFDQIVTRWERPLFAFAWRYLHHAADAQDVVAETFVILFRQRTRLRPDTNLSAWLFTTLSNLCHNQARWRRRHPEWTIDESLPAHATLAHQADERPAGAAKLEQDEARQLLRAAVNRLPHHLKTAVLLHYIDGRSYQEISEITGCSPRGVETRLYRARRRLRQDLTLGLEHAHPIRVSDRINNGAHHPPGITPHPDPV